MRGESVRGSAARGETVGVTTTASDFLLMNSRVISADFILPFCLPEAFDFVMAWRGIEISKADFVLPIALVSITKADFALTWQRQQYTITKSDFSLSWQREQDYQSVVIDIHNPESPVYGSYS